MPTSARIVSEPIRPASLLDEAVPRDHGAALLFLGVVRAHNDGRSVSGLRYDAYREMAEEELEAIVGEARDRFGVGNVVAVHRVGELDVGEVSVAVRVSSAHRADAYDASRWVMEQIKDRLPVWKKERYVEGGEEWLEGRDPRERGGDARERSRDPLEQGGDSPEQCRDSLEQGRPVGGAPGQGGA